MNHFLFEFESCVRQRARWFCDEDRLAEVMSHMHSVWTENSVTGMSDCENAKKCVQTVGTAPSVALLVMQGTRNERLGMKLQVFGSVPFALLLILNANSWLLKNIIYSLIGPMMWLSVVGGLFVGLGSIVSRRFPLIQLTSISILLFVCIGFSMFKFDSLEYRTGRSLAEIKLQRPMILEHYEQGQRILNNMHSVQRSANGEHQRWTKEHESLRASLGMATQITNIPNIRSDQWICFSGRENIGSLGDFRLLFKVYDSASLAKQAWTNTGDISAVLRENYYLISALKTAEQFVEENPRQSLISSLCFAGLFFAVVFTVASMGRIVGRVCILRTEWLRYQRM